MGSGSEVASEKQPRLPLGHESQQTLGDGEGQGKPGALPSMGSQKVGHD